MSLGDTGISGGAILETVSGDLGESVDFGVPCQRVLGWILAPLCGEAIQLEVLVT
jgi:hypothetical protein